VLIVTNIPNPYRLPLFNELNNELKRLGHQLKVVFGTKTLKERKFRLDDSEYSFDYSILRSTRIKLLKKEATILSYKGLLKLVNEYSPERIIIIGYSIGTLKLWLRSLFLKTNYIIWGGTIPTSPEANSYLRNIFRRILIRRSRGFIAYGSKAKEYFIQLGAKSSKVQIAINTVDTSFFEHETQKLREKNEKSDNKKHLTYLGYLNARKNVSKLLNVVEELNKHRSDFVFDIIGDGPQREELIGISKEKGLEDIIRFHGFKQKAELPQYLAISNVFLFQTDFDIWGLVLNEAMAAGLTCLSSIHAGATYDLIDENKTGFAVDFKNINMVVDKINYILNNPQHAKSIAANAQKYISEKANIKESVKGFIASINGTFL
jgi:glycosyltransferase involved in cell wall biosynthesis